jgi:group II intron reverse transcriptase/maturase
LIQITSRQNIAQAFKSLKSKSGSKTPGVDGKTIRDLEKLSQEDIYSLVNSRLSNYRPQKIRQILIPKPNGKLRQIGIPTIVDRLIQQCIKQVIEPIVESKFHKDSYGFRPNRDAKGAITKAYNLAKEMHYVIDIDIKGFFDNINHGKLLKQIWSIGVKNKTLIAIISKMLKTEVKGKGIQTKGTPQGGILSPLLANIYLNELDHWISNKGLQFVRYADDFKIFCKTYQEAEIIFEYTKKWLSKRLKLEINTDKSRIVKIKKQYTEFLGIKFRIKRQKVESNISKQGIKEAINKIKQEIRNYLEEKKETGKLKSIIRGQKNYYQIATKSKQNLKVIRYKSKSKSLPNEIKQILNTG